MSLRKYLDRFFNNPDPQFHSKVLISLGIGGFIGWKVSPSFMFNHTVISEVNTLRKNRYYTLFTSAFSEKDGLQVFFNSLGLWFFASQATYMLGAQGLYTLYFTGSLAQFLGVYYKSKYSSYNERSLPALTTQKAAVASVFTFYILNNPWSTVYLFIFPVPAILVGLLMIVMGNHENDNNAYLFGASGSLMIFLLTRFRR